MAPASSRPFHVKAWVPAARASPVLIVRTTTPAAFCTVHDTVAAERSRNENAVVLARLSPSCGKNTGRELAVEPRAAYTATDRGCASLRLPARSLATKSSVYGPSATYAPSFVAAVPGDGATRRC